MALQLDAMGSQPFNKCKNILWGIRPSQPSLSCTLEVNDMFDRCNYVDWHTLFNKSLVGDVCCSVSVAFTTRCNFCSYMEKQKTCFLHPLCSSAHTRITIMVHVVLCHSIRGISIPSSFRLEFRVGVVWWRRGCGEIGTAGLWSLAVITGSLPAISLKIWASEPDKDTLRDTIAFSHCLSSSSSLVILFLFHCTFPL